MPGPRRCPDYTLNFMPPLATVTNIVAIIIIIIELSSYLSEKEREFFP
jgi:hypothetical protein